MPSRLSQQVTFDSVTAHTTVASRPHSTSPPPPSKKQRMSLTQTYRLAHRARGKLSQEASRGDHDLRLLVGHANLLDGLMVELQTAEREQEAWFEETVAVASKTSSEPKRVSFVEEHQLDIPDSSDEEEESSSDDEEEVERKPHFTISSTTTRRQSRARSPPAKPFTHVYDDEDDEDALDIDDDEDFDDADLALVRVQSRSPGFTITHDPVPELVHESESSSDEESESDEEDITEVSTAQKVTLPASQQPQKPQQHLQLIEHESKDDFLGQSTAMAPMIAAC